MKVPTFLVILALVVASGVLAAPPAKPGDKPDAVKKLADVPENLKPAVAIIAESFPTYEAKKFPKAPADTGYIFRNDLGTVDAGFQDGKVVYLIFKVGVGQPGMNAAKARTLHETYHKRLLHESWPGQKYRSAMVAAINAVVIVRNDVDPNALTHGM